MLIITALFELLTDHIVLSRGWVVVESALVGNSGALVVPGAHVPGSG